MLGWETLGDLLVAEALDAQRRAPGDVEALVPGTVWLNGQQVYLDKDKKFAFAIAGSKAPKADDAAAWNKRPEWGIGLKIAFILFGFVPAMAFFAGCARVIWVFYVGWWK